MIRLKPEKPTIITYYNCIPLILRLEIFSEKPKNSGKSKGVQLFKVLTCFVWVSTKDTLVEGRGRMGVEEFVNLARRPVKAEGHFGGWGEIDDFAVIVWSYWFSLLRLFCQFLCCFFIFKIVWSVTGIHRCRKLPVRLFLGTQLRYEKEFDRVQSRFETSIDRKAKKSNKKKKQEGERRRKKKEEDRGQKKEDWWKRKEERGKKKEEEEEAEEKRRRTQGKKESWFPSNFTSKSKTKPSYFCKARTFAKTANIQTITILYSYIWTDLPWKRPLRILAGPRGRSHATAQQSAHRLMERWVGGDFGVFFCWGFWWMMFFFI